MANEEQMTKREWEAKIIVKVLKDSQFRKRFLDHPKKALKEIGYLIPETVQIKVIEEQDDQWILVVPQSPTNTHLLSDAELNEFAGGTGTVGQNNMTQVFFQSVANMGCN